jgi:hypothetical protein
VSEPAPDDTVARSDWGRVAADGTVFVRTADGERTVGSWQTDAPEQGLAFFTRRFDDLETSVHLVEQRLRGGAVSPDAARDTARRLRTAITDAAAVGDLDGLLARIDALDPLIAAGREQRRAERMAVLEQARARKVAVVEEAEALAEGNDWRGGVDRLRELLEQWKGLARLDKAGDDELWRRFSAARTTYTRRRKAHLADAAERREAARLAKEALVAEAEQLATSRDWGPTSAAMRDLMTRWKAAGRAPREVDDTLWARFRAAQDVFYSARDAATQERDAEFAGNLEAKRALLTEAEALLPVADPVAARARLRSIQDRWSSVGKVPRDAVREVENRLRAVEEAVGKAQDDVWRRSNPEARARAQSTVTQLRDSIATLEAQQQTASAAGDVRRADEAAAAVAVRRTWLEQAESTLADLGGEVQPDR